MLFSFAAGAYFFGGKGEALKVTERQRQTLASLETSEEARMSMSRKMETVNSSAIGGAKTFSIDLTARELNSYLDSEMKRQPNLPIKELRVELAKDELVVNGVVGYLGLETFVRVSFALLTEGGNIVFEVQEASIGQAEIPDLIMSNYIAFLNKQIRGSFEGRGGPSFAFGRYQGLWRTVKADVGLLHVEGDLVPPDDLGGRVLHLETPRTPPSSPEKGAALLEPGARSGGRDDSGEARLNKGAKDERGPMPDNAGEKSR
jgi:hypothetical protein